MENKIEEAEDFVKQAEKCLKTNLLRWKPDYYIAAEKYQQAALCYRNAREFAKSKDCLLRAADCYQQNLALFHAAKCLDQVTLLSKDLNEYKHVLDLGLRASYLFLQYGAPEAAVNSLERAGKILESQNPEQSVKLYQRAAEILKNEDNLKQAAEFLNRSSRVMVRVKMYDQAADAIRGEIQMLEDDGNCASVGRLIVGLVLIHLTRDDCVAAEKVFKQWGSYCQEPERLNLDKLLHAFEEEDYEVIRECLNDPFITHMDVEFAKLAKNMPILKQQNSESSGKQNGKLRTVTSFYESQCEASNSAKKETEDGGGFEVNEGQGNQKQDKVEELNEEEEGLC